VSKTTATIPNFYEEEIKKHFTTVEDCGNRNLMSDDDIEEDPEPGNPDIAEHRKFIEWMINSPRQWVSLFQTNNTQYKNIPHNKIFETDNFLSSYRTETKIFRSQSRQ